MKTLTQAFWDIIRNLRRAPLLFGTVIFGIAAALCTHLITFGFIEKLTEDKREYSVYNTVSVIGADSFGQSTFEKITSMPDIKNAFLFFLPKDADYILVGWYGNEPENWFPLGEGAFLSGSAEKNEAYVSTDIALYDAEKSQSVTIGEKEYEIVGSASLFAFNLMTGMERGASPELLSCSSFVFVNLEELLNTDISDACIRVQFDYDADGGKRDFSAAAYELFAEYTEGGTSSEIFTPSDPFRDNMSSNLASFVAIGCLCLISYMNIIGMYLYHLSLQKRRFRIYMIVGARKKQMLGILICKYAVLFSLSFAVSLALSALAKPLFERIRISYILTPKAAAAVFLSDFILTLIICIPKMMKLCGTKYNRCTLRRGNES